MTGSIYKKHAKNHTASPHSFQQFTNSANIRNLLYDLLPNPKIMTLQKDMFIALKHHTATHHLGPNQALCFSIKTHCV